MRRICKNKTKKKLNKDVLQMCLRSCQAPSDLHNVGKTPMGKAQFKIVHKINLDLDFTFYVCGGDVRMYSRHGYNYGTSARRAFTCMCVCVYVTLYVDVC